MYDFAKKEEEILKFWKDNKIFEKLREKNQGKERWSFLDGPITANNSMGVHHAWGRTYKDLFQRYKAMQGFDQRFQNGFDCQGLWVEVEVEKELGFKTKKDIEIYGMEKFIEKCKERVSKYSKIQTQQSIRLGQWMDWENSYYTMSDENNYSIWYFLKKCKEEGLLYKGKDVVPWCPRCGTAISQHEILTEEYKEVVHQSIFIKFPVVGREKAFFLAWTTTPWTLPANVALAVHSGLEYVEIKDGAGETFILLKEKADLIFNGEILKTMKGSELKEIKYQGIFDDLPAVEQSLNGYEHQVVLWDEVTSEDGTGIVHIAPGCGQEDFMLGKEVGLPVIDPTNEENKYKDGFGELTGSFVFEGRVRDWVFENLKNKKLVFKIQDYNHRYPTCWRCKSELIFRLVEEWYISMDKLRDGLVESVKKVEWIPSFGLERELDWLKNMHDWLISKKRYWGLSLPIFECHKCGNFEVIGSREELKQKAVEGWEEFDPPAGGHSPHRPWIDKIKIKCSKCGEIISRIPDVGNPWLDAGIVPFSTTKYFSNREYWQKWFPIHFICESFPGQFKNWFYSLLVMSQVLEKNPPVKTIFGYATVVDENGEEMHKSKGNTIWFDEAVEKIGADVMRWMYVRQNPVGNLRFGYNSAKETQRKLLILWNCYTFFEMYVLAGDYEVPNLQLLVLKDELNKWIISRLNDLIKNVAENLDKFDAAQASEAIEDFFVNDLSLWYVRRSRQKFQNPKNKQEKDEAAQTLYFVLLTLSKIIASMMPFLAEGLYQNLVRVKVQGGVNFKESVHLEDWPKFNENMIDKKLEQEMARTREIVTLALAKRAEFGIKTRQPLTKLKINQVAGKLQKELLNLVKEEVNVKEVVIDVNLKEGEVELDTEITDELKNEGEIRDIIRQIQRIKKELNVEPKNKVSLKYKGDEYLENLLKNNVNLIKEKSSVAILGQEMGENLEQGRVIKIGEKEITVFVRVE